VLKRTFSIYKPGEIGYTGPIKTNNMENTMTAIQKLIDQTLSYAAEAADNKQPTLAKCHLDDWKTFNDVAYLLKAGYTQAAGDQIDEMDTEPREQMIMAILADYDHDMLEKLGFALV
jgi:hypothetical protein